jgi:GTPase SAR1 family protein
MGEPWYDVHQGEKRSSSFLCGGYVYRLEFSYELFEFYNLVNHYAIVLAFDILSRDSWAEVMRLQQAISRAFGDNKGTVPVLVLGLKTDLESHGTRVPRGETEGFAQHHGYLYAECSASTGEGVYGAFASLVEHAYAATIGYVEDRSSLKSMKDQNLGAFARVVDVIYPDRSGSVPRDG